MEYRIMVKTKNNINKLALTTLSLMLLSITGIAILANPVFANPSASESTNLIVNVAPVLSLALQNCPSAPDPDETSLTLELTPTPAGTFRSNCQIVSVDTNAPGYSLLAKAEGTHPEVNSGAKTNSLIYQNPTTLVSPNYPIIQSTASLISSPSTISPNYWGFALNQAQTNVDLSTQPPKNFDPTYTEDNRNNKFANLPITDTTIYQTDIFPGQTDIFNFFYAVNINTSQPAGLYQTTVTYTAIANEVPEVPQGFGWKLIATGISHTCGIGLDDKIYCWGGNTNGQLGNNGGSMNCDWNGMDDTNSGMPCNSTVPVAVHQGAIPPNLTFNEISAGQGHTCVIASDENVYCWGSNGYGQLGNGAIGSPALVPTAVDIGSTSSLYGKTVISLALGGGHTCVIASDNNAHCWGASQLGVLGNGVIFGPNRPIPVAVDITSQYSALRGKTVLKISSGAVNTCVIASDNNAYCWGSNYNGQIGDGISGTEYYWPTAVDTSSSSGLFGKTVSSIAVGNVSSCVIASDNNAYCWGSNYNGQIGDGTNNNSYLPIAVDTSSSSGLYGKTVSSLVFSGPACVIASEDKVYCWGWNDYGQIGDGTIGTDRIFPTAVDTSSASGLHGKTPIRLSDGVDGNICVIASNNQAYCWGKNSYGQLGVGSNSSLISCGGGFMPETCSLFPIAVVSP